MTVNITALINNLGSTYENINDAKLIPYKSKPRGDSGDTEISLNMVKEGVFLAFERSSRKLIEVDLELLREGDSKYEFPNELPYPLWRDMLRPKVYEVFGKPENFHPPFKFLNKTYGGVDHYIMRLGDQRVSMLLHYNLSQIVVTASFEPTELVQWKELDPSLLI
jgi:hypothetical protein